MRLLLVLLLLSACGPTYRERLQAEEAARQQAACQAAPADCLLYRYLAGEGTATEAPPPTVVYQPQRQVLWPWPAVGGRPYPGNPVGYTVP